MNQHDAPESDEPIIQTVAEPLQQLLKNEASERARSQPQSAPPPSTAKVRPFRPTNRQPLAMLTVLDDGNREEGELIRIRDSRFSLGR